MANARKTRPNIILLFISVAKVEGFIQKMFSINLKRNFVQLLIPGNTLYVVLPQSGIPVIIRTSGSA